MSFEVCLGIFILLLVMIISTLSFLNKIVNIKEIYTQLPFNRLLLSNIYDSLKTGDLIFYRSSIASAVVDTLIPTPVYKHVSMIVKINGILYTTESSQGGIYAKKDDELLYLKNGVEIVPLLTKIKYYCGMVFITQLSKPLSEEKENMLIDRIKELKDIEYPSVMSLYLDFIFNIKISKTFYCFQYVYNLFEYIELIPKKKLNSIELSYFITNINIQILNDDYYYDPLYQLVYDYE